MMETPRVNVVADWRVDGEPPEMDVETAADLVPGNTLPSELPADDTALAPANFPRVVWSEDIAIAKPFLISDDNGDIIEALPPEKENRKIIWSDEVELCEMPNRRMLGLAEDSEDVDDDEYEIEIVEDDGDADFYLEIVDGEIFYVFETEDDSEDEDEYEEDSDSCTSSVQAPLQLPIASMMAPSLDEEDDTDPKPTTPASVNSGISLAPPVALPFPSSSISPAKHSPKKLTQSIEHMDKELDLADLGVQKGRPELLTTTSDQQEISLVEDADAETLQESFHESFHASTGSWLVDSPEASPITSPNSSQAGQLVFSPLPTSPKEANSGVLRSPMGSPVSPTKSILKANPPSPRRKVAKKRKEKKEKTVTKTYVRADTFDGEHQVYTWEKPVWAQESNLRETEKGSDVRKGANLASPITFPKRKSQDHSKPLVYEDEQGNVIDKEELIRRIQEGDNSAIAFVPLPTYGGKHQRKLKFSEKGQKMRSGMDLAKPITKATVDRERDDINHIAQPDKVLKKHVETVKKTYSWQKPDWARKVGERKLGHSPKKAREYKWEQPSWITKKLSSTSAGDALKQTGNLQKPITVLSQRSRVNRNQSLTVNALKSLNLDNELVNNHSGEERRPRARSFDIGVVSPPCSPGNGQ